MNWRNPFLITYLSVTVVGAGVLGYLLYSGYSHYSDVEASYEDAVSKLQKLQNKVPFPNADNNQKYVEYTKEYRAEYNKLLTKVASMQKSVEDISPQDFQDRLRANVSEVVQAAKDNNVSLGDHPENFYLGFDQYRGTLPNDQAAGPLARQLASIRLIIDDLIALKVKSINGVVRDTLPEEGGAPNTAPSPGGPGGGRSRRGGGEGGSPQTGGVVANSFDVAFTANQSALRGALNNIASAEQFFVIRNLTITNSAPDGPKKVDDTAQAAGQPAPAQPAPGQPGADPNAAPAAPAHTLRVLVGREALDVVLRIEMITFNNLPPQK